MVGCGLRGGIGLIGPVGLVGFFGDTVVFERRLAAGTYQPAKDANG